MPKKAIFLEIDWRDISTYSGEWLTPGEVDNLPLITCKSVGILVGRTKDWIKIAQTINNSGVKPVSDVTIIPLGNVTKIRRLQ